MKEKIYLDTSIVSAYFDDRQKGRQKITKKWWDSVLFKEYDVYISELVEAELANTSDTHLRGKLANLVKEVKRLEIIEEAEDLARYYVKNGLVPVKYWDDAVHIALASNNEISILCSWNFAHMVNHETKMKLKALNILKGYREIEIESPLELGGMKYV